MADRVILRLTKSYRNLNAGETAGFEPDEAAHILKNQGGEKYVPEAPAQPTEAKGSGTPSAPKK